MLQKANVDSVEEERIERVMKDRQEKTVERTDHSLLAIWELVIRRKGFVLPVGKSILFGNAQYLEHGLVTRSGRQPNVLVYVIDALEKTTLEKIVNEVEFVR